MKLENRQVIETRFNNEKKCLFNQMSFFEKICLIYLLNYEFKRFATSHIKIHERKLLNLWRNQSDKCPDSVLNLSKRKLSVHELNALRFGLSHLILPKNVQKDQIKVNVEN